MASWRRQSAALHPPVETVTLGLGLKHSKVEPDVETEDQIAGDMVTKPRQYQRQRISLRHHRIINAVNARACRGDRHAGIDQHIEPRQLVTATDGADLDDPVAARTQAGCLEVERHNRHAIERHCGKLHVSPLAPPL